MAEIKKPQLREGVRAKFIDRWALRYVDILTKQGKDKAMSWGMNFFNDEDIPFIAEKAKEILKKKGLVPSA